MSDPPIKILPSKLPVAINFPSFDNTKLLVIKLCPSYSSKGEFGGTLSFKSNLDNNSSGYLYLFIFNYFIIKIKNNIITFLNSYLIL